MSIIHPRVTPFSDIITVPCQRVALLDGRSKAELYADDFDWLMQAGWSINWTVGRAKGLIGRNTAHATRYVTFVCASRKGSPEEVAAVARLIVQAMPGQYVKCRDGNPLNLRRNNLHLVEMTSA